MARVFQREPFPTGGFFAATVLVVTYHVFSRWLTLLVRTHSSHSVKKLLELQPDTARLVRDGVEGDVPIKAVGVGDLIRVRPGERVAIDGRVASGRSAVDESLVTGESMPVKKNEGDEVIGGAINGSGTLLVEVSRVGEDTFLQQIVRNIEDARALKPGVVDLVGRVLEVYIPSVLALAVLAGVFWIMVPAVLGDGPDVNRALFATLGVLIMGLSLRHGHGRAAGARPGLRRCGRAGHCLAHRRGVPGLRPGPPDRLGQDRHPDRRGVHGARGGSDGRW